MSEPRCSDVAIVGGGLAGLATAVALTQHGIPVTLFESRNRLGGRACSFDDPLTGETIDHCQHVSMGCCTALQQFCSTVGIEDDFCIEKELTLIAPDGRQAKLKASWWPAPFHLAWAFIRLPYLTFSEKRSLATTLRKLAQGPILEEETGISFLEWLHQQQQSDRLIERFWEVFLVSALSESLDRIDIRYARKVFVDGFLRHRSGWEVYLPTVPLDELYGRSVLEWLTRHGCTIRTSQRVRRILGEKEHVSGLEFRDGSQVTAEEIVLAVPHHHMLDLLPECLSGHPILASVRQIESAPITSLHMWFDRPITDLRHAVLIGRLSQWMFARSVVSGRTERADRDAFVYQVVISASRHLADMTQEEIRRTVLKELCDVFPEASTARLLHSRQVTEQRAVFSVTPGIDRLRPLQQSPISNLQLAGDWTATSWPSTMESAVRSGYLAAENILKRRGADQRLLPEELPTSRLSRWLFGF